MLLRLIIEEFCQNFIAWSKVPTKSSHLIRMYYINAISIVSHHLNFIVTSGSWPSHYMLVVSLGILYLKMNERTEQIASFYAPLGTNFPQSGPESGLEVKSAPVSGNGGRASTEAEQEPAVLCKSQRTTAFLYLRDPYNWIWN